MKKILVSSCLLGNKVRFDAKHCFLEHPLMLLWNGQGRIYPFCPEVAAGLPTPRHPVEIVQIHPLRLTDKAATDYTESFVHGANLAVTKARQLNITCVLLKSKSPSCGRGRIYNGSFNNQLIAGNGVTASLMLQHNITVFNEFELDELANHLLQLDSK